MTEIEQVEKDYETAMTVYQAEYEEAMNKPDVNQFMEALEKAQEKLRVVSFKWDCLRELEESELPEYGDHMTIAEFTENVKDGGFTDWDGHADGATATHKLDITLSCDDVLKGRIRKEITHVVWYNK